MSIGKDVTLGNKPAHLVSKGPQRVPQNKARTHRMQVDVVINSERFTTSFTIAPDQKSIALDNEPMLEEICKRHEISLPTLKTALLAFAWDFL